MSDVKNGRDTRRSSNMPRVFPPGPVEDRCDLEAQVGPLMAGSAALGVQILDERFVGDGCNADGAVACFVAKLVHCT